MKIIRTPNQIRSAIRSVLSDSSCRRIIAVAFVGTDALSYLPDNPAGIELYCWPKAGGTNPDAIDQLLEAGVNVKFVRKLHMKLYWGEKRGAVIGSANLTNNALSDTGLQELAVKLPPKTFDAKSFVKTLPIVQDFKKELRNLRIEHIKFYKRNRLNASKSTKKIKLPSYIDWFNKISFPKDVQWRLGMYDYKDDNPLPSDVQEELEEKTGNKVCHYFLAPEYKSCLKKHALVLSFSYRETNAGYRVAYFKWWSPDFYIKTEEWDWCKYIWIAKHSLPSNIRPPFNCNDQKFKKALSLALVDCDGSGHKSEKNYAPSKKFLRSIAKHYSI